MVRRVSIALWLAFIALLLVQGAWLIALLALAALGLRVYSLRSAMPRPRPAVAVPAARPENATLFDVPRRRPGTRRR